MTENKEHFEFDLSNLSVADFLKLGMFSQMLANRSTNTSMHLVGLISILGKYLVDENLDNIPYSRLSSLLEDFNEALAGHLQEESPEQQKWDSFKKVLDAFGSEPDAA